MFELRPYRRNSINAWNPFSEMEEMEKRLKADLPGFKKEDIHLNLDGDTLTIQAERHSEHEDTDKKDKYVCCERSYGSYSRSFDVSGIQADGISASYEGGVLELKMPKKEAQVPASRQISIQ